MVTAAVGLIESPLDVARMNFDASAARVLTNPDLRLLLSACSRDARFQLPIRLDNGELRLFDAFRTHHSSALGPHLGALRFSPEVSSGLMFALAQTLTWKAILAEVHFGGAMGGVLCNPEELSGAEAERITRAYVAASRSLLGPFHDVLQPEAESGPQFAGWMHGEYAARFKSVPGGDSGEPAVLASVVGKAESGGGIADREQAVLRGVQGLVRRVAEERGKVPGELRVAVSGSSAAVTRGLAVAAGQLGCKLIETSDARRMDVAGSDAVLQAAADVLILAGKECAVHAGNAPGIVAPVIVEASDLCVTPAADKILARKGTVVIPSLVGNAATVVAAHLEWDANLRQVSIGAAAAGGEIEARVLKAYDAVRRRAAQHGQTLRAAAYDIALERAAAVERLRMP
jgi:glutamate dehydrogenase/leucine dehydrogenase